MYARLIPPIWETQRSFINSQAELLSTLDRVLPWAKLLGLVRPGHSEYPSARLEMMLRTYLVQVWFGFSDDAAEAALHDSLSIRAFVGVDQGEVCPPGALEIREFRERLESIGARRAVKTTVDQYLLANRYFLCDGSRIEPVLGRYEQQTGYLERLAEHFETMTPPYELSGILQFNAIYREAFDRLNPAERRRAEQFVERLIEGAASPAYVPRIFGVV